MSSPSDWMQFYHHNALSGPGGSGAGSASMFGGDRIADATVVTTTLTSTPSAAPPPQVGFGSSSSGSQLSPEGRVTKPMKKRSRASRRTPTTLLNTDTSNFRAMVQQFTGGPASFGLGMGMGMGMGGSNHHHLPATMPNLITTAFGLAATGSRAGLNPSAGGGGGLMAAPPPGYSHQYHHHHHHHHHQQQAQYQQNQPCQAAANYNMFSSSRPTINNISYSMGSGSAGVGGGSDNRFVMGMEKQEDQEEEGGGGGQIGQQQGRSRASILSTSSAGSGWLQ